MVIGFILLQWCRTLNYHFFGTMLLLLMSNNMSQSELLNYFKTNRPRGNAIMDDEFRTKLLDVLKSDNKNFIKRVCETVFISTDETFVEVLCNGIAPYDVIEAVFDADVYVKSSEDDYIAFLKNTLKEKNDAVTLDQWGRGVVDQLKFAQTQTDKDFSKGIKEVEEYFCGKDVKMTKQQKAVTQINFGMNLCEAIKLDRIEDNTIKIRFGPYFEKEVVKTFKSDGGFCRCTLGFIIAEEYRKIGCDMGFGLNSMTKGKDGVWTLSIDS
jgi:hypothetical protein